MESEIEVEIADNHSIFSKHFKFFKYMNGEILEIDELILNDAKIRKSNELQNECNKTILGRFYAELDGVTYQFSCDNEAQKNFDKALKVFEKGWRTELLWTVYDMNGNVLRLIVRADQYAPLYMAHLDHIQYNISKFRDTLQPIVENAQTVDEVKNVTYMGGVQS
jgi:hypothetical protein